MQDNYIVAELYNKMTEDPRLTVWHISLYATLLVLWQQSGFSVQVKVSRRSLMTKAHFGSKTTYHKCLSQLCDFGYIVYSPTYDSYSRSTVKIIYAG